MRSVSRIAWVLLFVLTLQSQTTVKRRKKAPETVRPECSSGAICFSGEVFAGAEYHRRLTDHLEFALQRGWTIAIVPMRTESDCLEFASVVNSPYRSHRALDIDMSYGVTAEWEVADASREFKFVTNCSDYRTEMARLQVVMWPASGTEQQYREAMATLGTSPLGKGRLWITDSKVTHADDTADDRGGKIEWMKFSVEIRLPGK
jgi:hypothetical protein